MKRSILQFAVIFSGMFAGLYWLFDGSGPVSIFNSAVRHFTEGQTLVAAHALRLLGESVSVSDNSLTGKAFTCVVDFGCNGVSAVALLSAGIFAFPQCAWRKRLIGFAVLVPVVVALNIVRIAGLYLTGAHAPDWFGASHVYVWQTVVICATAGLWLAWLSWSNKSPREPSPDAIRPR